MFRTTAKYNRVFARFARVHLLSALEYQRAFWLQVLGMMLNNGAFVVFWAVVFAKFAAPFAASGVKFSDVMLVWALNSSSFGLCFVCFAGTAELTKYITDGRLDLYLLYPKHPLLTLAASKSQVSAWGDLAYGFLLYFLFVPVSAAGLFSFVLLTALSGALFAAVLVLANSLSFWWGSSEELAQGIFGGMIQFGIYPERVFSSEVKFLLFSVLPVGFLIYLPVRVITRFDPLLLAGVAAADAAFVLLAFRVFRLGLRRYESGNQFAANQ